MTLRKEIGVNRAISIGQDWVGKFVFAILITAATATASSADGIEVHDCAVRFSAEVKVPALTSGRVAEVSVAPNDSVKVGAPLARLDGRSLLIQRRAAQLRYDNAKADSESDIEVEYAKIAKAEAEAELEVSRSIQKDARGAVPMTRMRQLKLAVERGELEVAQAMKRLKRAEVEAGLREADLAQIDDQLKNLSIESPIGGLVLEVNREPGEWVETGQPVAAIGRIDRLHVHALLSSKQIAPSQCRGSSVSVHWVDRSDGNEKFLRGTVLSVDPQMLPGGQFRFHAEIINQTIDNKIDQWQLYPGTEVRMKVFSTTATAQKSSAAGVRR